MAILHHTDGLNKSNERMRYTRQSIVSNTFYQMPRFLTAGEFAGNKISNNARFLYTLLLDRHKLSVKNDWVDENGEVYIYFRREEMEKQLGLSDKTVSKVVQELKDFLLVEEKKQGLNKPNKIYLLFPVIGDNENPDPYLDSDYDSEKEHDSNYDTGGEITTVSEAESLRLRMRKNYDSEHGENTGQGTEKLRPSNTKLNKTEEKNNNLSKTEWSKTTAAVSDSNEIETSAAAAEIENSNHADESIPYSQILKMYNKVCETNSLRPIRSINGKRKTQTAERFREYGFGGFVDLFEKTSASVFLCGGGVRGWKTDFDWLIDSTNMQKVLEGKYDGDQSNTPLPQLPADEPYQPPLYSNSQQNNRERHDPFLERAMMAYATAADAIQTTD